MACFYPCLSCGVRIFTPFSLLGSCEKRHRWKGKKGHPHLLKKQNDVVLLNHEKESENCKRHTEQKVSGVLLPNFLWREGRSHDIHTLSAGASLVVSGQ